MSELIPLIMRFTLVGSLPGHLFAFWDPTWQTHFPGDQRCCALYFASTGVWHHKLFVDFIRFRTLEVAKKYK